LDELRLLLADYANDVTPVSADDVALLGHVALLRSLLECLYGQRITFRGERRDPTGTRVDVEQILGAVHGHVVAADVGTVGRGVGLNVRQNATEVTDGAEIIGIRIDRIG